MLCCSGLGFISFIVKIYLLTRIYFILITFKLYVIKGKTI